MGQPFILDGCCSAGGAGRGYVNAGFRVRGVDIKPQKHYPYDFVQQDILEHLEQHGREYDLIHVSPPCQFGSGALNIRVDTEARRANHVNLIPQVRELLEAIGKPYIIENVVGSREHLIDPLLLCGTMFGLKTFRHRLFETNPRIYFAPAPCMHNGKVQDGDFCNVAGTGGAMKKANGERRKEKRTLVAWSEAMGIDWMTRYELTQAIPPAYTEYIGRILMRDVFHAGIGCDFWQMGL